MTDGTRATTFLSVHPVLAAEDLAAALAYYRDKLGFTVAWQWGSPPFRAGVTRDGLELQLTSDPDTRPKSAGNLYFHVTGVEAYYRQCVKRDVSLTRQLEVRPWGMRDFAVEDPTGNQLGFGEATS